MQRLQTKEFIFLTYALLCFQTQIFSQNYNTAPNFNPVPPSSFQFIKYGEIPVSEYTGIPTISIPVYTIKDGDIEFPINLSYHAGGIRVAEEASWVGLGWNLDLGNITQIINDRDDLGGFEKKLIEYYGSGDPTTQEFTYKYNYPRLHELGPTNIPSTGITKEQPFHSFKIFTDYFAPVENASNSNNYCCQFPSIFNGQGINLDAVDSEPDVFKANFNGHYLEFIFNFRTNNIVVLNKKNYIVSFTKNQVGVTQWNITCPDGMVYQFNQVDEVKLDFSASSTGVAEGGQSTERNVVNRVWHLTKIISPNNRQINFEWETTGLVKDLPSYSNTDFYSTPTGFYRSSLCGAAAGSATMEKLNGHMSNGQPTTEAMLHGVSYSRLQNSVKSYVSSIAFSMGSIDFKKSLRKDRIADLRLDSIIVKSTTRLIKKLNFSYDYFVATEDDFSVDKTVSSELQNPNSGVFPSQYHPNYGLLCSDFTSNELRFRLKLVSVGEEGLPSHRFKYDNGKLPKKTSYATDYWGFYNGKTTNTSFVPNPIHIDVLLADNGNDRRASLPFAKACTLNEIVYPTGGITKLEYQLNNFVMYKYDNSVSPEYQNAISPISEGMGLRVGFTTNEAEGKTTSRTRYTYEGGRVILPINFYGSYRRRFLNFGSSIGDVYSFDMEYLSGSNSYASSLLGSGNFIGYDKVTKESLNAQGLTNGKTETSFYNNPDITAFERSANMALPARKNPLFPDNGLVKKIEVFNSIGQLLSSKVNQYIYQISDPYYGIKFMNVGALFWGEQSTGGYGCELITWPQNLAGYYPLYSGESLLQWSEKREFGEGVPLTIRTNFSYFSDNTLTSSFSQNSDGENSSIFYQYPKNNIYLPPNIANALLSRNIVSETISERTFKEGSLVLEKKKNFDFFNSLIKVKSIVEQVGANLPEEKIIFDRYDEFGNPLSYHKPNDVSHSYVWGCNNSFPVAEVKNAQVEQIAFADFEESSNQGGWTYVISQNQGKSGRFGFSGNSISKTIPLGNYEIRFWAKRLNSLNGSVSGSVSLSVVSDEWQYFSFKTNSTSSISLNLSNVVLDDVALFPVGAQLTSFCHDPLIGLISLTDPNGMITNFKYDKNGRLTSVIDHAGNIVKEYKYGYKIN